MISVFILRRNVSVLGIDEIFSITAPPFKAIILYNNAYGKWSLALYSNKDNCFIFSDTASSAQDMIEECKKYIIAEWEHNDQNGFESWKAKNFKILLK